jgi:hypothetical protein
VKIPAFRHIPPQRLLIYLLILGMIPAICVVCFNLREHRRVQEANAALESLRLHLAAWQRKEMFNHAVRNHHRGADHYYVDKYLESLSWCQREVEELGRLIDDDPSLPDRELLERREFLEGPENQLRFAEGGVESYAHIRETEEKLVHPVELAQEDLSLLLARLEGTGKEALPLLQAMPQILITDFRLQRRTTRVDNEVYLVELQFIKREFL